MSNVDNVSTQHVCIAYFFFKNVIIYIWLFFHSYLAIQYFKKTFLWHLNHVPDSPSNKQVEMLHSLSIPSAPRHEHKHKPRILSR